MKWLLLAFSVIKPLLSSHSSSGQVSINPVAEIKDFIKENAMKVFAIFAAASTLSTLFAAGIVIIAVNLSSQYDVNGVIAFNSVVGTGLGLSVVSFLIAFIAMKTFQSDSDDRRKDDKKIKDQQPLIPQHPLQNALALLITDFVNEREHKRAKYAERRFNERQAQYETSLNPMGTSEEHETRRH